MEEIYYDTTKPGSFGGVAPLAKESGKKLSEVKSWLSEQDAYTLHKPTRRRFRRRKTFATGIDDLWQADLVDLSTLEKDNDGNKFLFTVIDVFSKYAWTKTLKNKTGALLRDAFAELIMDRRPNYLQTDKGKEFINATFQQLLSDNNIKFYTSQNDDIKCAIVERYNRTLKTRMWRYFTYKNTRRYIDVLPDMITAYNLSYHRSIKAAPIDVTIHNEDIIRCRLYAPKKLPLKWKFNSGDRVRISQSRLPFQKGYLPGWSIEIFTVKERVPTDPPTYKIADYSDEAIQGKFYAEELQKVVKTDDIYKVEKVLKTRKRAGRLEYFVKWIGYPEKFNSWTSYIIG